MIKMQERIELFKSSPFYLNWLHPLISRFLPTPKENSHGLSLHNAMKVVKDNNLKITGHLKIGDIEIIETE